MKKELKIHYENMKKAITINYNLTRDQIKEGFLTKEEGIKAYTQYAKALQQVYIVDKEFERWNNLHIEKLKEL